MPPLSDTQERRVENHPRITIGVVYPFRVSHLPRKGKVQMAKKINYASLFTLRKDGRYQGSYTDDAGRHFIYDRDPERLWHKLNDQKEEQPLLFRDIAIAWYNNIWEHMPDGTKASYEAHYKRAIERLGDRVAAEISAYDIQTQLEVLKARGYAASTIDKQRIIYRAIYRNAIVDPKLGKIITYNPADHVKMPSGLPKAKKREAPEDEIVKQIQEKACTAYFGKFALFLMCTGFRRGEALAVKWKDVDRKAGTIRCYSSVSYRTGGAKEKSPKTESGFREVPILAPVLPALKKPEGALPTDYIFPGEDPGKPMPKKTYDRRWMHYCKDMCFVTDDPETRTNKQGKKYIVHNYKPTITAHVLRHGYATILFEAGVDVYTAQKLLGHSDIETTMAVYTHLREKKKNESLDKLKEYTSNGL